MESRKQIYNSNKRRVPQYLNTAQAAEYLCRAEYTLKRWRIDGKQPAYIKDANGRIWYRTIDLIRFKHEKDNRNAQ